jgi:hypothetical protein
MPSRLCSPNDVHAPFAQSLSALGREMIEHPCVLLRLVRHKPPALEQDIQQLHSGYTSEVVVARAGLTHSCVVSDLALCLLTSG